MEGSRVLSSEGLGVKGLSAVRVAKESSRSEGGVLRESERKLERRFTFREVGKDRRGLNRFEIRI